MFQKTIQIVRLIFLKTNLKHAINYYFCYLKMKKRSNIFKLSAFLLCSLYLLSSTGMAVYACACTNNMQLSLIAKQTKHSCVKAQKHSCCAKKQITSINLQGFQFNKKPCCTTQAVVLKTEHRSEQIRLNILSTDFSQPILFANAIEITQDISPNDIVGSLSRHVIPPKIPLIYQHSCLRL